MQSRSSASIKETSNENINYFLEGMNITLNRHHELRCDVVSVALTDIMYHWFNCDKNLIYRQNIIKFYSDIYKIIGFLCIK